MEQATLKPCLSVSFSVSTLAYRVSALELSRQSHQIQVDFENGEHVFASPDFDLGTINTLGGQTLVGRFSFRYTYDSALGVITVCGTDYASADGMTLVTRSQSTDQACFEHAAQSGFADDEVYGNAMWNYNTQLMPGAAEIFKGLARDANEALIKTLMAQPQVIVQVRKALPRLPLETYLDLCVVYRDGYFLELYDPNRQYGSSDKLHPFESVFGGTVLFNQDENFANVIGSTKDPKIKGKAWIRLWEEAFGIWPACCTSLNYRGFSCGSNLIGGHIIRGQSAQTVAKGSDSVYIFPICTQHNNNNYKYMAAVTNREGVWLKNYMGS